MSKSLKVTIIYFVQTYLLVCTFDTWTNSFKDLIYLSVLQIFAWGVPLTIISACYYKVNFSKSYFIYINAPKGLAF